MQSTWFQAILVDDSASQKSGSSSDSILPSSFGIHIVRGKDSLTKVRQCLLHCSPQARDNFLLQQSHAALAAMTKSELLQLLQQFEFPIAGATAIFSTLLPPLPPLPPSPSALSPRPRAPQQLAVQKQSNNES